MNNKQKYGRKYRILGNNNKIWGWKWKYTTIHKLWVQYKNNQYISSLCVVNIHPIIHSSSIFIHSHSFAQIHSNGPTDPENGSVGIWVKIGPKKKLTQGLSYGFFGLIIFGCCFCWACFFIWACCICCCLIILSAAPSSRNWKAHFSWIIDWFENKLTMESRARHKQTRSAILRARARHQIDDKIQYCVE